jgi:hypothetical protein
MAKIIGRRIKCRSSRKTVPQRMTFDGHLDIQSAKGGKSASINLVAYKGGPMVPEGFRDKVIVDLDGCKFQQRRTPIIADHDVAKRIGHTTKQYILTAGKSARSTTKESLEGPLIYAEGVPSSGMGIAKGFVEDAANGFPFQVSIGADIEDAYFVDEGEKVVVNGKRWKGPLVVASQTSIAELTVCVLGADRSTSATLAAKRNSSTKEIYSMTFGKYVASLGFKLSELNATQRKNLRAKHAAELAAMKAAKSKPRTATKTKTAPAAKRSGTVRASRSVPQRINASAIDHETAQARRERLAEDEARIDGIRLLCSRFQDDFSDVEDADIRFMGKKYKTLSAFKSAAIKAESASIDAVELSLMKASAQPDFAQSNAPAAHIVQQIRDMPSQVFACAMTRQSGIVPRKKVHEVSGESYGYEVEYDQKVLEASDSPKLRGLGLHQLMDFVHIQANGYGYHGSRRSTEFIEAVRVAQRKLQASGPTTMTLSTIFEDSGHKMMWAAYQGVKTTWQEIARTMPVSDFRPHNVYRLGTSGAYKLVGVDGQLETGGWTEDKYTHAADTYGKIVGLNRKHLINDDMGAFNSIMAALGEESAKTKEELVWLLLMGNLATLFPTNNSRKNYISGATSTVSIEGYTLMTQQWNNQVDADNSAMLVPLSKVIVGTNNEIAARQMYKNSEINIPPQFVGTQRQHFDNPHAGLYPYVVSPFINNTAIKQRVSKLNKGAAIPGQTQTGWFAMADPNNPAGATIIVSLLNGRTSPILESADAAFDVLGLQWRAYDDFGVDEGDYRFMAFSKGAA